MKVFLRGKKTISVLLLLLMMNQILFPSITLALTGGPSQPEVQSFQPAGTTEMVDLFSGDFSYNIPLFELPGPNGGYPFNLSYQAGVGMDQESSWCGLGWNLQPGAITRQMRGLPDEFKGDAVYTKTSVSPSVTIGLGAGVGAEFFGGSLKIGLGFGVSFNNYKGAGYSIDGSVGYSKANQGGMTGGIGVNFSLDSKEGVNVNPSLSLGSKTGQIGIGAGYNSKEGLSSVSATFQMTKKKDFGTKEKENVKTSRASSSSSISLSHPGYTPQISMPMRSVNLSATFKIGADWWGIFPNVYVRGFYNEQWLKNDKKRVGSKAYGYLNYQNASDPTALLDINREKDGMVIKESSNLAMPCLSYDIYSVSGQGISAMYRPLRNDYGRINDPEVISKSNGGSVGVDVGPAASHIGVNLGVNHSRSNSGAWNKNNDIAGAIAFQDKKVDDLYEPWYFKVHGEPSVESTDVLARIGGEGAVRVQLGGDNINPVARGILESNSNSFPSPKNAEINRERKPRSQVIQNYTNEQLLVNGQEILPQFRITYIDSTGAETPFVRKAPGHHIAAFTALTPEGLRYNYGLPAYNSRQEEVTFSVTKQVGQVARVNTGNSGNGDPQYNASGTEKFLKRVEMPPFAHSHMLTSILGPDYVDVTGDGVTKDDLGYWVKFTYKNTATKRDPYKWRDPFSQAHFQEGWKTDPRDDKGSFIYGEREMWYMAQAETKSHIATFSIEEREDGKGVADKLQDSNNTGKSVYALKEIRLFARFSGDGNPIKIVKLNYDYSLCNGIDNSSTKKGKLTLKKLWFEYGSSSRGKLNPYIFDYHENDEASNPRYDNHAYDRWGNFKPYPTGDYLHNYDFPYTEQDPLKKAEIDASAAAWSLKEIQLPSGGKIIIDYESDDYGYVQHLPAMQMVELVNSKDDTSDMIKLNDSDVRVRFKLESSLEGTLSPTQQQDEVSKYLDLRRKQLYFKIKMNLRKPSEGFLEYISGYAEINTDRATMGLETDASGKFAYGYFEVIPEKGRHPFSMRAWQHLRTNQPELANSAKTMEQTDDSGERVNQIRSLGSIGAQIKQMFQGFYKFCSDENWGREIEAGKSWIRLNSPDKIKYGGGLRVRQITMKDQWSQDEEGIYGQVYEYDIEESSKKISSGVATYEPFIGGEENPLRYAKKYVQTVHLRSSNNLFFEYPINETYYPGPQIGYRKVTVTSLASANLSGKTLKNVTSPNGLKLFPQGDGISYGTTGKTEHEFYTAKDFPVITDETEKQNKPKKLAIPIPLIGNIELYKLSASQGYSIVTNDMHGKPKKVSNYRQDNNGNIEPTAISWVKYNYASKAMVYDKQQVSTLLNTVTDNGDGTVSLLGSTTSAGGAQFTMGQENEFFTDMREFQDDTWGGGINPNVDILYILWFTVPIPVPLPNISKSTVQLRTSVSNKIIFKSGVLESTEAFDGGSTVKTTNLKWNKLTCEPVLTSVNNNFDASIYNYTVPAFTQYQGMGAAYQNAGLTFTIQNLTKVTFKETLYEFTAAMEDNLTPGDEILLYPKNTVANPIARVIFIGKQDGQNVLYSAKPLMATEYTGMIARSGHRNQLSVSAGTITALEDPTKKGVDTTYSKVIKVPK